MKKALLVVFITIVGSSSLLSQDTATLSDDNGIGEIKLGETVTTYLSKLRLDSTQNNLSYYSYIGKDHQGYCGYRVTKLNVYTIKGLVYKIAVQLDVKSVGQYNYVRKQLEELYGPSRPTIKNNLIGQMEHEWLSGRTGLTIYTSRSIDATGFSNTTAHSLATFYSLKLNFDVLMNQ